MRSPHDDDRRGTAILLDVDGTLVDSNDAHARAWVDAFAESGHTVDYDRVRRSIGMGGDKLMPAVSGIEEDSPEGKRISRRRAEIFKSRYLPQVRAFPQVRELVERFLRDGHTVVVASSAKKDELGSLLEAAGIADLVGDRTSSDDAEESKPDPDIVAAALAQAGVGGAAAVMLGDTPYDVEAAARAGIRIVAVECGGWGRGELTGAAEVYCAPADLLARYDSSLFARIPPGPRRARSGRAARLVLAAPLLVLAGYLVVRRLAPRGVDASDPPRETPAHAGLGPRERAELRDLISRTS